MFNSWRCVDRNTGKTGWVIDVADGWPPEFVIVNWDDGILGEIVREDTLWDWNELSPLEKIIFIGIRRVSAKEVLHAVPCD